MSMSRASSRVLVAAGMVVALGAVPVLADVGPTEAQREAFIAAITANGCQMSQAEAPTKLPPVGITKELSLAITQELMDEGLAEQSADGKSLILKVEGCPK